MDTIKKHIAEIFLISIFLTVIVGMGLGIYLQHKNRKQKRENPTRISVEFLRSNFIKISLKDIDATQFLGDAESGIKGNETLYDKIVAESKAAYPDKYEYYQAIGSEHLNLDGLVPYGNTSFSNYYRVIYIKEN